MAYHDTGDFLASGLQDGTARLWDLVAGKCKLVLRWVQTIAWRPAFGELCCCGLIASQWQPAGVAHAAEESACSMMPAVHYIQYDVTAAAGVWMLPHCRGHAGAVTGVAWQPFTNNLATCSADSTVMLWDVRTGLCTRKMCGHEGACSGVAFSIKGDMLASVDAAGRSCLRCSLQVASWLPVHQPQPASTAICLLHSYIKTYTLLGRVCRSGQGLGCTQWCGSGYRSVCWRGGALLHL